MPVEYRPTEYGANSEGSPFDIGLFLHQRRPAWMQRGSCRSGGYPDGTFWPEANDEEARARARKVCKECPVRSECLEWGLAHGEIGIWGGLTEKERRRLSRRLAANDLAKESA